MKLRFKHQQFQADAARAVVEVFRGQPRYENNRHFLAAGTRGAGTLGIDEGFDVWGNHALEISETTILKQLQAIQREQLIKPSENIERCLAGRELVANYNLSIEMETGVGKTYTYIKTMFELNKHYGWSKFIVIVPSVAIREGVYKSFQITQEHFADDYGKKLRFSIYNSARLSDIRDFACGNAISVLIINTQAFNARGADARRIFMALDEFGSRRPIDVIAGTRPILIIDEPQSVEGEQTVRSMKEFEPLMILRYSATHKKAYNMIYRLDALDAYNKRLVKKIIVKGIELVGTLANTGYVYCEKINVSQDAPTVTLHFDKQGQNGVKKVVKNLRKGDNLYPLSGGLEEYKNNFLISGIDGTANCVTLTNGEIIHVGEVRGATNVEQLRRLQIRETIISHIERERELFDKGIKVLSLFFIDEVAKYREYNAAGTPIVGEYAKIFEEEYASVLRGMQLELGGNAYQNYLNKITAAGTHAGYFSVDKKGKMVDSSERSDEKNLDAYDLIMKNKELLLDLDPERSPVRFIFSHSALREGWDNPNVFQICTLKESNAQVRKRQEIGRGMRLCVNQNGERMDENVLGNDVHRVNALTVIANESYQNFANALQNEIAEAVANRPQKVDEALFVGKIIKNATGVEKEIDQQLARAIVYHLVRDGHVDNSGKLTEKYYEDKRAGTLKVAEEVEGEKVDVVKILDSIYNSQNLNIEDGNANNVELKINKEKLSSKEFKELWKRINGKTVYTVAFDDEELVKKAINKIDSELLVPDVRFNVVTGTQVEQILSRGDLIDGNAFVRDSVVNERSVAIKSNLPYDLVGELADRTKLTRKVIVKILKGINRLKFDLFKKNPEEFIIRAGNLIDDEKATVVVQHVSYDSIDEKYDTQIFTEVSLKGKLGANAIKTQKHLFDHLVFDSDVERRFAGDLDVAENVAVYVKLPSGFKIATPVGDYNPDWAIAFKQGCVKHIYFVAETKGSLSTLGLRGVENAKIECAKKHFAAIAPEDVIFGVVNNYEELLTKMNF